jgi:acetyltransferase-like isoleucine patch superfamily enzyme
MRLNELSLKIRRRETPFYDLLFKTAFRLRHLEFPVIPFLFNVLYYERNVRHRAWHHFLRFFYYEPIFKARCDKVGKGLFLEGVVPDILGHVQVTIGENAWIGGHVTFGANRFFDKPRVVIGDNVNIGWYTTLMASNEIRIGNNCNLSTGVFLQPHTTHPNDPVLRRPGPYRRHGVGVPERLDEKSLIIGEDVGIARHVMVLAPVTIGNGAHVGAASIVMKDVPPYTIVGGIPAKVLRKLEIPDEERKRMPEEMYQKYLDAKIGE